MLVSLSVYWKVVRTRNITDNWQLNPTIVYEFLTADSCKKYVMQNADERTQACSSIVTTH